MTLSDYQELIARWAAKEQEAAAKKLADYGGDPRDVMGLLKATAARQSVSVWETWQAWAWRHVLPIEQTISQMGFPGCRPAEQRRQILQWRMQDLLGFCFIALAILQEEAEPVYGGELNTRHFSLGTEAKSPV